MKPSLFMAGVVSIAMLLLTCCTEDTQVANDKVNLTFRVELMNNNEGQLKSAQMPPGAIALISVETDGGELVVDQQEVVIMPGNDGYLTAPLVLPKGNYRLVDLMIIDESGEVAFAAPREGSALSKMVARSLPYEINDKTRVDTKLSLIDTHKKGPKHFGYDCFRGKQQTIKVQVFTAEVDGTVHRATAEALIMKGLDTIRTYTLNNAMNFVTFKGNPGETYSLVVVKDSYARFAKDFKVNQIPAKPLKVILPPAFTVVAVTDGDENYLQVHLDAGGGLDFHVDWGDGTTGTWKSGETTWIEHNYSSPGQYFVSVTGPWLDAFHMVGNTGAPGRVLRIGTKHLTNLQQFLFQDVLGPAFVDLSANRSLLIVSVYPHPFHPTPTLIDIKIPNDADLFQVELTGNTNLKPESLEGVINSLHHQIVTKGRRGGDFIYSLLTDPNVPIVPPSEESLVKLREMKHSYNWLVVPDPDGIPF